MRTNLTATAKNVLAGISILTVWCGFVFAVLWVWSGN